MDKPSLAKEILSLIEAEGPTALGALLGMVLPSLPGEAIVQFASDVEALLTAGSEKSAMQSAVKGVDADVDAAEAALGK